MSQFDEDSISGRPTRGNSRRRTKDRPDFSKAEVGQVIGVDRGRITCLVPAGELFENQVQVTTVKARELGRKGVVIGDRVRLVGDLSGAVDTLARLVEIIDRETVLTRTADDSDPVERVIVANADQMAIVTAAANPEPRIGLIDRALVAAFEAGLEPLLIITKVDLGSPQAILDNYSGMDLRHIEVNQQTGAGISEVRAALSGRKHTSTSARAIPLPNDSGWVIDTPGLRSFGLAHVKPEDIIESFPELVDGANECPRACTHVNSVGQSPPDCALDEWVSQNHAGSAGEGRLTSLRRLLFALQTPSS